MKKTLVLLMASAVLSIGAVQAATTNEGPVTKWLNNTTAKVSKQEQTAYQKTQAKKQAAEKKKAEAKQKQAAKEKKIAAKKAEAQKQQAARKQKVETKKKQWKELFTID